jgi:hypothetical protein
MYEHSGAREHPSYKVALVGFGCLGRLSWYEPVETLWRNCAGFRYSEDDDWLLVGEDLDRAMTRFGDAHPDVVHRIAVEQEHQ